MQDEMIVEMYWQRDEKAIAETDSKYGNYLLKIACSILSDIEEGRESLNDTYLRAWNSMPPQRPQLLRPYLVRLARQSAIDLFRRKNRKKRAFSQYEMSLSELETCVSKGNETQDTVDMKLLASAINQWLRTLQKENRIVFVGRYYFMDSIKDIADYCSMSQSRVKSMLFRSRASLREYLRKEGFDL